MNIIREWLIYKLIGKCALLANVDIQGCYINMPKPLCKDLFKLQNNNHNNNCKNPMLLLVGKNTIASCIIDAVKSKKRGINIKIRPYKGYIDRKFDVNDKK